MAGHQPSLFHTLKPLCVALNETVRAFQRSAGSTKAIFVPLQSLSAALEAKVSQPVALDARLCDYVFFPVSQIFRERGKLPVRHLELALRCLQVLLRTGWRKISDPEVAVQLLILLTFLADDQTQEPQSVKPKTSEELRHAALVCMRDLFRSIATSQACVQKLLDTANIPTVGHAVSVLLDGVKQDQSVSVKAAASETLKVFVADIASPDVLQAFLPGVVSAASQVIVASVTTRPPFKVLQMLLQVFTGVVKSVLSDARLASLPRAVAGQSSEEKDAWLKTTSAQLKLALANVVRLRDHGRPEVRSELQSLCWVVLVDCHASLYDSVQVMFETFVVLDQHTEAEQGLWSLDSLFSVEPLIAEDARSVLYEWVVSLPRIMTSNDDDLKAGYVRKIASVYRLLVEHDANVSVIDDMLASNLTEGMLNALHPTKTASIEGMDESQRMDFSALVRHPEKPHPVRFPDALIGNGKSTELLGCVQGLSSHLATSKNRSLIMRRMLDTAQSAQGQSQVIGFWLSLSIARAMGNHDNDVDDFLDLGPSDHSHESLHQELYAFALSILSQIDGPTETDWRMQALALEAVALQAQHSKQDFRPELVDALYPVVHLMGSHIPSLRNHAVVCLNLIAQACGYTDAQDLLVSNVDYLVNAISIKLNTFDLSPQAPQVLLMMTKLCGPRMLPYLDDLVDGVFDALECFHGYPKLVELLFSVLNGIVEEGSKAPEHRIEPKERISHRKQAPKPLSANEAIANIKSRHHKALARSQPDPLQTDITLPAQTPRHPWRELRPQQPEEAALADPSSDLEEAVPSPGETPKPKPSKTYSLLTRIASLTQHHLPTPSPTTRALILSLLSRAIPALATDEDTFLPLVHTLWPVLTPRLHDTEAYVVAGTLDVLGLICEAAGDFVTSRVEGLWGVLREISRLADGPLENNPKGIARGSSSRTAGPVSLLLAPPSSQSHLQRTTADRPDALVPTSTKHNGGSSTPPAAPHPYTPTPTYLLRGSLTTFLIRLLTHVRLPVRLSREALHTFLYRELVAEGRADVRAALEVVDREGVWLVLERAGWEGMGGGGRMRMWKGRRPLGVRGVGWVGAGEEGGDGAGGGGDVVGGGDEDEVVFAQVW